MYKIKYRQKITFKKLSSRKKLHLNPLKKTVMEYEKHDYAPEGFGAGTEAYEEDLLFYDMEWEE